MASSRLAFFPSNLIRAEILRTTPTSGTGCETALVMASCPLKCPWLADTSKSSVPCGIRMPGANSINAASCTSLARACPLALRQSSAFLQFRTRSAGSGI